MSTVPTPGGLARARAHRRTPEQAEAAAAGRTRVIRVLSVDDHALLVEGLRTQFEVEGDLEIVGSLSDADQLLPRVDEFRPDVVTLDIEMPGTDVFEVADQLRHLRPDLPFIFLSAFVRDGYLSAAIRTGAAGYCSKSDEPEEIAEAVRQAVQPEAAFVMSTRVRERVAARGGVGGFRPGAGTPMRRNGSTASAPEIEIVTRLDRLTDREIEVLRLIGKGLSRCEIASELHRSPKTIDGHQERLLKKTGLGSRTELMRFAIREGLAEA
jgi:NarL family two-component system response regulator LiaR